MKNDVLNGWKRNEKQGRKNDVLKGGKHKDERRVLVKGAVVLHFVGKCQWVLKS
jgi:hypothetical protein